MSVFLLNDDIKQMGTTRNRSRFQQEEGKFILDNRPATISDFVEHKEMEEEKQHADVMP